MSAAASLEKPKAAEDKELLRTSYLASLAYTPHYSLRSQPTFPFSLLIAPAFSMAALAVAQIRVVGMTCVKCVARVTRAIESCAGVSGVTVDLETGIARVDAHCGLEEVLSAIRSLGYEASLETDPGSPSLKVVRLLITGMSCGKCQGRVEKAATSIEGVSRAEVDLDSCVATVEYNDGVVNLLESLIESIRSAGYQASLLDNTPQDSAEQVNRELTVGFTIKGMSCAKCVAKVEGSALGVEGVLSASVDLDTGRAFTVISSSSASTDAMVVDRVVERWRKMGYEVTKDDDASSTIESLISVERKPSTLNTAHLMPLLSLVRQDSFTGSKEQRKHLTFSIEGTRTRYSTLRLLIYMRRNELLILR